MSAFATAAAACRDVNIQAGRESAPAWSLSFTGLRPVSYTVTRHLTGCVVEVGGIEFRLTHRDYRPHGTLMMVDYGMPSSIRLNPGFEPVWSDVRGNIIARKGTVALVDLREGETLKIFFPDGRIAVVEASEGLAVQRFLSVREALQGRLGFVTEMFAAAAQKQGAERIVRQDRTFHELASLLRLTALYPELRKDLTKTVGHYAKNVGGKLNPGVQKHFHTSLRSVGESPRGYWWLSAVDDGGEERKNTVLRPSTSRYNDKSTRRLRDQQFREMARGPAGSKPNPGLEARQRREAEEKRKS